MTASQIDTLVFDLDDTLIDTSEVYYRVKIKILDYASSCGIERNLAEDRFELIEDKNHDIYGHDPLRYSYSAEELFNYFRLGKTQISVAQDIARRIADTIPEPISGSYELLEWCLGRFNLSLLTRGESNLQRLKIEKLGLKRYFGSKIRVTKSKTPTQFRYLLSTINTLPARAVIIGDSLKADIAPANAIGSKSILYLYKHDDYEWRQDASDADVQPTAEAETLLKVRDTLSSWIN